MEPGAFAPQPVRPAILAAALLIALQVAGKATRDALFLSNFDVALFPVMTALAATVSLLAVLAFARGMAALSPARLLPATLGASAALFLAEWALALAVPRLAAVALYLHQAVLGAAVVSGFWSLVNERFDPYSAKRFMGAIGAGAGLGGVAGGLLTWVAASLVSLPSMLAVLAVASVAALASVLRLTSSAPDVAAARPAEAPSSSASKPMPSSSGLRLIREIPYLRNLALLVALCALLEAVLDYLLNAAAATSFPKGAPLMSFFALLHGVSGLIALIVQAGLVPLLLQTLGLAGTLAIQPLFAALGAGIALALHGLWPVTALRAGQTVLRNSTFRSSYELLYTPLPNEQKRPTKVIVDVGCDRLGTVAGAGAVMLVLLFRPAAASAVLLALAALIAGLCLALVGRFQRGYVGALEASLRTGAGTLEAAPVVEATTLLTLASLAGLQPRSRFEAGVPDASAADPLTEAIADLRSGDPARVRRALSGTDLEPTLVPHVIPLLAEDRLFETAVRSLRRAASRSTGQLIDALLDPRQDPVVRRRIPRVLRAVPSKLSAEGLAIGLSDSRFDIRYRCGQALLRVCAADASLTPNRERMLSVALREANEAVDSDRHLDHVFRLLALVLDREPLTIALRAWRNGDAMLRGTALEYLDNVLPVQLRDALWPRLGGTRRPAPSGRSAGEIRDELLRSTSGLKQRRSTRGV